MAPEEDFLQSGFHTYSHVEMEVLLNVIVSAQKEKQRSSMMIRLAVTMKIIYPVTTVKKSTERKAQRSSQHDDQLTVTSLFIPIHIVNKKSYQKR